MTNLNLEAQFNQWAPTYDHDVQDESGFPFAGYTQVLNRAISLAQIGTGTGVLELGAGTGNLTRKLVDAGATVWALDFSSAMLAIAMKKVPEAQFGQADLQAEYPPQFERKYDRIMSTYTFHEIPLEAKVELIDRLIDNYLAPGGSIIIGDIGFVDAAAHDAVKMASGGAWDDEYYWVQDEATAALHAEGMTLAWEQISACSVVIGISRLLK